MMNREMEITCLADIDYKSKVWMFSHPTCLESHYTYDSRDDKYTFCQHGKIVRWGKVPFGKGKGLNFENLEALGEWIHEAVSKKL